MQNGAVAFVVSSFGYGLVPHDHKHWQRGKTMARRRTLVVSLGAHRWRVSIFQFVYSPFTINKWTIHRISILLLHVLNFPPWKGCDSLNGTWTDLRPFRTTHLRDSEDMFVHLMPTGVRVPVANMNVIGFLGRVTACDLGLVPWSRLIMFTQNRKLSSASWNLGSFWGCGLWWRWVGFCVGCSWIQSSETIWRPAKSWNFGSKLNWK